MKKFKKVLEKPWAAYTFAACAAVLVFLFFQHFSSVKSAVSSVLSLFSPVFTGLIIAYLFNPVSAFFEKTVFKKVKKDSTRHVFGVVLTVVCLILIIAVLLLALIPSLAKSITKLVRNWGSYTQKLSEVLGWAESFAQKHGIKVNLSGVKDWIDNAMDKLFALVKGNYKKVFSTLGTVGKGVGNFFVGVLFGFCFLIAKGGIIKIFNVFRSAVSSQEKIKKRNQVWANCHKIFLQYIGSTLVDALIVGVATLIFMLIAGMPYAPLIAVVVGITNIIPTFGPLIGNVIGCFFLILEKPLHALIFCIFVIVLQSVDGMLIKPKLFKDSLGIPGVWTLVLIILGGKIAGMAGIILAIPFAAMMVILYRETMVPRLERRRIKINKQLLAESVEEEKQVQSDDKKSTQIPNE